MTHIRFDLDIKGLIKSYEKMSDPNLAIKVAKEALEEAYQPVLDKIIENSPVKTGDLEDSHKKRRKTRKHFVALDIVALYYSIFLEYGTSKMPPQPYIRPAIDEEGPEAVKNAPQKFVEKMASLTK